MKLVSFYKVAKLNKIDSPEKYQNKLLVLASSDDASLRVESNYQVLSTNYKLEEVRSGGKKYLLVDTKSSDISDIEKDLQTIEDVEILDDNHFLNLKRDQKKENDKKYLGTCSFCGKKLTTESSMFKSMGPVCEHKAMQLDSGEIPIESYSKFKPLGAMKLKKGDSVVLKTKEETGFYEYITQKEGKLVLIDRKKMFVESKKSPTQAVHLSTKTIPVEEVLGVCSPSDSSDKKTGPWQEWLDDIFKD